MRAVIFDIGNVLTDYRWKDFLKDKGFEGEMADRIARASTLNPVWVEYDRGVWTEEQVLQAFVDADPEIESQLRCAFADFTGLVAKRDFAVPWIRELREKGFEVYYLSNFSRKAHRECADCLDFIFYTDGGLLSYQEKLVKPDPAFYKLLLARYELQPGECVFVDDMPVNVEAARALGMNGIVFQSQEQTVKELGELL